ncbi:MAG: amidohydrolase family protein [Sphingobacteriales bacterium]|nr:amidohydrolase family protein [Sphingobacteriales bacterium]
MKTLLIILVFICGLPTFNPKKTSRKILDTHLHGSKDPLSQMQTLQHAGVYKAAISSSWDLQNSYRKTEVLDLLYGLMLPCPEGKVPYSLQPCYALGEDWPPLDWVEQEIKKGRIDFIGEVLNQYYGISPSDTLLYSYYQLAQAYNLPVGIHTGGAGPDHGSPNFKLDMGSPLLLKPMLARFPGLKVWIMHSGDQYYKETIGIMQENKKVYADISVISNPDIVPASRFSLIMQSFITAGLEDRLMFGTDNGDIEKVIGAVEGLDFLSAEQKKKLFYLNAEQFFGGK